MNKKIKARWVKALRSGKYKQGRSRLKDDQGRFCCLGLLCELHAQATGTKWSESGNYLGAKTIPPNEVMRWAGLGGDQTITIRGKAAFPELHNDAGRRFSTIAKAIEEQL